MPGSVFIQEQTYFAMIKMIYVCPVQYHQHESYEYFKKALEMKPNRLNYTFSFHLVLNLMKIQMHNFITPQIQFGYNESIHIKWNGRGVELCCQFFLIYPQVKGTYFVTGWSICGREMISCQTEAHLLWGYQRLSTCCLFFCSIC